MPPHSITPLIVKTKRAALAGLSISHYLSRRGVWPAHTSAGLDMQTLMAIHQMLHKPHNCNPRDKVLYFYRYSQYTDYIYKIIPGHPPTPPKNKRVTRDPHNIAGREFHWRKRSLVGCILRGQISAKAPSAKSYIRLACLWGRKLNDANWFYPPNKPKIELTLSSKLQYTIYLVKAIPKHDV